MSELFPAYNPDDVVKLLPETERKDSLLSDVFSDVGEHHFHKGGMELTPSSALESMIMNNILFGHFRGWRKGPVVKNLLLFPSNLNSVPSSHIS